jgi:hypothetical protein
MESVGGNATISEWGDAWHYREVTPTEVDLLLGIGEASVAAALGSLILLAIISRSLTLADGALFSVEIDAQECPED